MAQLDSAIAHFGHGAPLWVALMLAFALGLRHATDPDHLAAVTTLVASDNKDGPRAAGRLGLAWGLGHALALFALGAPAIVLRPYLPAAAQHGAEVFVGAVIVFLAIRLLRRWRQGRYRARHSHRPVARSRPVAFTIGLLHGFGGSAGASVLVLANFTSRPAAVGALALLAIATAFSMTVLSTGFGLALVRFPAPTSLNGVVPLLGVLSLAFGAWYGFTALGLIPLSL